MVTPAPVSTRKGPTLPLTVTLTMWWPLGRAVIGIDSKPRRHRDADSGACAIAESVRRAATAGYSAAPVISMSEKKAPAALSLLFPLSWLSHDRPAIWLTPSGHRKTVVEGTRCAVRVHCGRRRGIQKKKS